MEARADLEPNERSTPVLIKHILRKIFLEDWVMKLVALGITLALWLGVTGLSTPTTELIRNVPLNLRFSSEVEVTGSELQQVDIIVSGDKRRVSQLNRGDLVVSVDLTEMATGEQVVNLTSENVMLPLPTGIKLDEILPGTTTIKLEPVVEKDIPVRVETFGELPEGYEVYSQTVVPETVKVRGPASYIQSLDSLTTERIDIANRRGDFTAQTVQLNRPGWDKITLLKGVVDVVFRIGETRGERVLLLEVDGLPERRATVVLYGPRSVLAALDPQTMRATGSRDQVGEESAQFTPPESVRNLVEVREVKLRP